MDRHHWYLLILHVTINCLTVLLCPLRPHPHLLRHNLDTIGYPIFVVVVDSVRMISMILVSNAGRKPTHVGNFANWWAPTQPWRGILGWSQWQLIHPHSRHAWCAVGICRVLSWHHRPKACKAVPVTATHSRRGEGCRTFFSPWWGASPSRRQWWLFDN